MAIPQGYLGKIYSRSGLLKHYLITAEAGVIDSGFRGDVFVFIFNHRKELYTIHPGDKVAQKEKVEFVKVDSFDQLGQTKRGECGFGSSDSKKVKFEKNKKSDKVIIVEDALMSENGKLIASEKSITIE